MLATKPILWEFNSFLMYTLSFVPINLHGCWPRGWKQSKLVHAWPNCHGGNFPVLYLNAPCAKHLSIFSHMTDCFGSYWLFWKLTPLLCTLILRSNDFLLSHKIMKTSTKFSWFCKIIERPKNLQIIWRTFWGSELPKQSVIRLKIDKCFAQGAFKYKTGKFPPWQLVMHELI